MTTILRIDTSPKGETAHSRRFADEVLSRLVSRSPGTRVVERDLTGDPPPYIDAGFAANMGKHPTAETARTVPALRLSETLISEVEAADTLLISTPMHNYTVPAPLKTWIDQVVRAGRTFTITPEGKVGKLADRPCYVVVASGGYFSGAAARQPDHLTPYLRDILTTIGLRTVHFITLEGVTRGDEALAAAYARARTELDRLLPGRA